MTTHYPPAPSRPAAFISVEREELTTRSRLWLHNCQTSPDVEPGHLEIVAVAGDGTRLALDLSGDDLARLITAAQAAAEMTAGQ